MTQNKRKIKDRDKWWYYCQKCKRQHSTNTKIGIKHKEYGKRKIVFEVKQ